MNEYKKITIFFVMFFSFSFTYGQLGFCSGSKGDPVFNENFGSGLNYGPQLPFGTTNYAYVGSGFPQDGQYTLFHRTNLIPNNWHFSLDRTPDNEVDGLNGKSLIVNASFTTGEFFKRTVSGLCINTTFEFSAWVMNIYNSSSGGCSGTGIPINISFEIWNDTETVLLRSGNTGNINGTSTPIWRQFGLVFTTTNQTSVVLIMKNNGVGGCGNDLAIDDIMFRSCGDLATISSPSVIGNNFNICPENSPANLTLQVVNTGTSNYFYQWQESTDNINWVNIPGANLTTYNASGITSQRYFRTKIAQDIVNLNNSFCSTLTDVFTINFLTTPNAPTNDGNNTICSNQAIPVLSVTPGANQIVNWYDSITNGNLLISNSTTYTPTSAGTFYAEAVSIGSNCRSSSRTPVSLTIIPTPTVTISGGTTICSGNSATVTFTGTPNATVIYNINGGVNQTQILDASGTASVVATNITSNTTYTLMSVISTGSPTCTLTLSDFITIIVTPLPTATILGTSTICFGSNSTVTINGTPNATVTYNVNSGPNQTQILDALGTATLIATNLTSNTTYTLVSISSASSPACTSPLSEFITITLTSLPTASVIGTTTICSGNNSPVTINGTPNATVTYNVNNGLNQTQILDALGTATILATNLTSNTTYTLVSVTSSGLPGCTVTLSVSVTITVSPPPIASISGGTTICSGNNATVTFTGTPNATVIYNINGGVNQTQILDTSGTASIFATNLTSNNTYSLVSVTDISSTGCTISLTDSTTIIVTPPPIAIFTGATSTCSGSTTLVTITGTPNASVVFNVNSGVNQTQILNASGIANLTATNVTSTITYNMVSVTAPSTVGCTQPLSQSFVITITPTPVANYTGLINYCSGETTNISLISTISGTTFSWTALQNGATGASNGVGNLISQPLSTIENIGNVIYTVTPTLNGCNGIPIAITVIINSLPVSTIKNGVVCINNSTNQAINNHVLDTNLNATIHSFNWYLNGSLITNASNSTLSVNQAGIYSVIATNLITGCNSQEAFATVSELVQADSLTLSQTNAFSDNNSISVLVNGGNGTFLYQLNDGPFQSSNIFNSVSPGNQIINVIDEEGCTNLSDTINIINYPHYFTPNDDGFNDTWNIKGHNLNSTIFIFDRYGKILKQIRTNGDGWDGTYNGRKMIADDYWFTIKYLELGEEKLFKSHFTLKR